MKLQIHYNIMKHKNKNPEGWIDIVNSTSKVLLYCRCDIQNNEGLTSFNNIDKIGSLFFPIKEGEIFTNDLRNQDTTVFIIMENGINIPFNQVYIHPMMNQDLLENLILTALRNLKSKIDLYSDAKLIKGVKEYII